MNITALTGFIYLLLFTPAAFGWGQTGHRVTGAIAERYLTDTARAKIEALLPNESLAEASTYADEMRSNPGKFWQETASVWHYVTVPEGSTYSTAGAPKEGDAASALRAFRLTLRDESASLEARQLALRFTIHLIGDLHQPLHAGNGRDRGGNNIRVNFFQQESNLHRVWDSGMIDRRQLSFTEWSSWLGDKIGSTQLEAWHELNPEVWIAESVRIRERIYPATEDLAWDYLYQNLPIAQSRLQQAGVRIAVYLNEVFEERADR